MTFDEFWKTYHREDPDEALENPHQLRIHMKNGKTYDAQFPGTLGASPRMLSIGVKLNKQGIPATSKYCNWDEIERIEIVPRKRPLQCV